MSNDQQQVSFEQFKPHLCDGTISTEGQNIVFETNSPLNQVILPIATIDFLLLCDGSKTIREIIEDIYSKNRTIHFKLIYKTVHLLREKQLFYNWQELKPQASNIQKEFINFVSLKPIFKAVIWKKLTHNKSFPNIFYILSLFVLLGSLFSLKDLSLLTLDKNVFILNESYLSTVTFLLISFSILLSIKNLYKCLLLILLTGRAYQLSFIFNGFSAYFKTSSESLFLITNKLYLTLYHLSISISPMLFAYLYQIAFPNSAFATELPAVACILTLVDLNPYQNSELNQYFRSLFQDESLFRKAQIYNNHSAINFLMLYQEKRAFGFYLLVSFLWSAFSTLLFAGFMKANYTNLINTVKEGLPAEKAFSVILLTITITIFSIVFINTFKLIYSVTLKPLKVFFRKSQRIGHKSIIKKFENEELLNTLESLPLFSYFSRELLLFLIEKSRVEMFQPNTHVIIQGDKGTHLYVLLEGKVFIEKKIVGGNIEKVTELKPVSIFGEVAAIEECTRTADVITSETSFILSVPSHSLRQVAKQSQYINEMRSFRNAIMVSQFFSSAPFFRELPEEIIHIFLMKGKLENYSENQIVFRQGMQGDGFYLIIRGAVEVTINDKTVSQIRQGGFFGEISLIADIPRTASVNAIESSILLKISPDAFWEILGANIDVALFIETIGEMRIKEDVAFLKTENKIF